jgi:vacuolar-type H+-ATPase subunit E/Vma4
MKTSSEDRSELIAGIRRDAENEAERIIKDAEKTVSDKIQAKEMQIKSIERDTAKKIALQLNIIEKNSISSIKVEKKRIALQIREKLINTVIDEVKVKIKEAAVPDSYKEILKGWILEASIGLGEEELEVNGSKRELEIMTESYIKDVEKQYHDLTGGKIKINKSDANPLFAQGIVLTSMNHKTAFNNQVPTRLLRYQSEMRKTIHSEFFA